MTGMAGARRSPLADLPTCRLAVWSVPMCYSDDARPPFPPVSGGAASEGDLTLHSADGTAFMAYAARAAQPNGRGVVILPDVRGLHDFYKELAVRFAEAGYDA